MTPEGRWRSCRPGFFLPVRVLGRVFRGTFLARLREAFARGKLAGFDNAGAFAAWAGRLRAKEWVVYSKPPFGCPARVPKYLARHTHRVAIGNSRLVKLEGAWVTFGYLKTGHVEEARAVMSEVREIERWNSLGWARNTDALAVAVDKSDTTFEYAPGNFPALSTCVLNIRQPHPPADRLIGDRAGRACAVTGSWTWCPARGNV